MAVPVILGLSWLGSIIFGGLGSFIGFLAQYLTKKIAITLVIVTIFLTITASMVLAVEALVNTVSVSAPASLTAFAGLLIPSNYSSCIGVCVSARVLRWVYDTNVQILNFKAQT